MQTFETTIAASEYANLPTLTSEGDLVTPILPLAVGAAASVTLVFKWDADMHHEKMFLGGFF